MIFMMILSIVLFIFGVFVFSYNRHFLLITLLSLEYMVLSLFLFLFFLLMNYNYESYFLMVFLTFSVCEGALGLSVLVSMIRSHGNNYFQSFNILLC